jgi:hypothetical protein
MRGNIYLELAEINRAAIHIILHVGAIEVMLIVALLC